MKKILLGRSVSMLLVLTMVMTLFFYVNTGAVASDGNVDDAVSNKAEMIAAWNFDQIKDGKVEDISGNGYHATLSGGPTLVDSLYGKAMSFDGVDDLAIADMKDEMNFTAEDSYSITAWVKTKGNNGWCHIFGKGRSENGMGYIGLWTDSNNNFHCATGGGHIDATNDGKWHCITITQDGFLGERVLYVDGVKASTGVSYKIDANTRFVMGGLTGNREMAKCLLDNVKIYKGVLSDSEIQALNIPKMELLGKWSFDSGSAVDGSGRNHNGTIEGATVVDGLFDKALSFDGNDQVKIPNSADFNFTEKDSYTITCWVKGKGLGKWEVIMSKGRNLGGNYYGFWIDGENNYHVGIKSDNDRRDNINTTAQADGRWHHLAYTVDAQSKICMMFVDGEFVGSSSTVSNVSNSGDLYIGSFGNGEYYTGIIDEVCIYNSSMTADQIRKVSGAVTEKAEMIAAWNFDQIKDGKIEDISGNGYHATLSGGPALVDSLYGKAMSFDGVDDLAIADMKDEMNFTAEDSYSITAWVKTKGNNGWCHILGKGRSENGNGYIGLWTDSNNNFHCATGGGHIDATNDGKWHCITITQDGFLGERVLYVDGVKASTGVSYKIDANTRFVMGGLTGNREMAKCLLDNVKIYKGVLSYDEIQSMNNKPCYKLTFEIDEGAEILLLGENDKVEAVSEGTFEVPEGEYGYIVSKKGYAQIRGRVTVTKNGGHVDATGMKVFNKTLGYVVPEKDVIDRIKGGWMGEAAGVAWGAPTEFQYVQKCITDTAVPVWYPDRITSVLNQDDLFVEIPFLQAYKENGLNVNWNIIGNTFKNTTYWLAHANAAARQNLKNGITAPWSGHYLYNVHCDDIDWQIEVDSTGMAAFGQPAIAQEAAWRMGHVMNYGDGVYGGVFVGTMYAAAGTAQTFDEIIENGINSVPKGTQFRTMMEKVLNFYKDNPDSTWLDCWLMLEKDPESHNDRCPEGDNGAALNIDARLNSAYILIGLLYGEQDLEATMRISMQCGQDSDCNPSSAGGILGAYLGLSNMAEKWYSAMNWEGNYTGYSNFNTNDCVEYNLEIAKDTLLFAGGAIDENGNWHIPYNPAKSLIVEQRPIDETNPAPVLSVKVTPVSSDRTGMLFDFSAQATDADGVKDYQWFFGDLSFSSGANLTHTYTHEGTYYAVCYTTDALGNTAWKQVEIVVEEKEGILMANAITIDASESAFADLDADIKFDGEVTWSSSDEKVAIVDSNGVVIAKGNGVAEITAVGGGYTAKCVVTVTNFEAHKHTMIHNDRVAPTCEEPGTKEFWTCKNCNKNFADKDGKEVIVNLEISALGHDLIHHESTSNCMEAGNGEYWECGECGLLFADEDAKQEINEIPAGEINDNHVNTIDDATVGHDEYSHWYECECGDILDTNEHDEAGENGACSVCGYKAPATDTGDMTAIIAIVAIVAIVAVLGCGVVFTVSRKRI